ncbi:uncharacterized protein LOC125497322 [Beta vulgaris subsp. vulgaris]|uniref:uncharacterized protein LOC125497322 n=1 Tax=Beta vulgaris subsp. vulgaris TaxID=3555 RepID=UPI00254931B1|nr:uncharacterized protein LOC125497322 [Beta vulgaris subsp. vulgaris]
MSKTDKKKRISDALEILCTQTDRDHINEVNGRNESSELFRSWMDFSIRMTKVAEDRLALVQEVSDLKQAARSHFDEVYQAKEAKRLAELRKEEVEEKIRKGEEAWQKEQTEWKEERPIFPWLRRMLRRPRSRPKPSRLKLRRNWRRSNSNSLRPRLN